MSDAIAEAVELPPPLPKTAAQKATVAEQKSQLQHRLWAVADRLRGQMDASNFKNYMLGLLFYRDLSIKVSAEASSFLSNEEGDFKKYAHAWEDEEYREELTKHLLEALGYVIEPQYLFESLLASATLGAPSGYGDWSIDKLATAFSKLTESTVGTKSQHDFAGLFSAVDHNSPNLGRDVKQKSAKMAEVMRELGSLNLSSTDADIDLLGDAYEYLIGQFASNAGKKAGEFYTPQEVSTLVARILAAKKPSMKSVYDPTCGSGSLLLRVMREAVKDDPKRAKRISLYGQELITETYNLARMNLILHGVNWQNFAIQNGNTLTEDLHLSKQFDAIGSNPPYSAKWTHEDGMLLDPRFAPYSKLAPQKAADYAFVQHILHHLKDDGVAAVVLPHGILFRNQAEGVIRKALIEKNYVDAIIGLPANLFYGTGIATLILVLRKNRTAEEPVRFIDASQEFEKITNQSKLTEANISKMLECYVEGKDLENYSVAVSREAIKANDFSLKIDLYVDATPKEELPSLEEVQTKLQTNGEQLAATLKEIERLHRVLSSDV